MIFNEKIWITGVFLWIKDPDPGDPKRPDPDQDRNSGIYTCSQCTVYSRIHGMLYSLHLIAVHITQALYSMCPKLKKARFKTHKELYCSVALLIKFKINSIEKCPAAYSTKIVVYTSICLSYIMMKNLLIFFNRGF